MRRHALGSATLEDVLAALVDGVAAVGPANGKPTQLYVIAHYDHVWPHDVEALHKVMLLRHHAAWTLHLSVLRWCKHEQEQYIHRPIQASAACCSSETEQHHHAHHGYAKDSVTSVDNVSLHRSYSLHHLLHVKNFCNPAYNSLMSALPQRRN